MNGNSFQDWLWHNGGANLNYAKSLLQAHGRPRWSGLPRLHRHADMTGAEYVVYFTWFNVMDRTWPR
jgi:hypothetical protein